jgi:phage tail sheath protein FI
LTKPVITEKIKESLKKLQSVAVFYENSDTLWSSLTETQATKLTNLVKN